MASFRGPESIPMILGDAPRYTKEILRKNGQFFLTLVGQFRDSF